MYTDVLVVTVCLNLNYVKTHMVIQFMAYNLAGKLTQVRPAEYISHLSDHYRYSITLQYELHDQDSVVDDNSCRHLSLCCP